MKKAIFKNGWPYVENRRMDLPVNNLDEALPFYQEIMGFRLVSSADAPVRSAILERDGLQIGLAENGGDPAQEGCFFEVDNVEAALEEFKSNGWQSASGIQSRKYGDTPWRLFYVIAPDGLCYSVGEKQV